MTNDATVTPELTAALEQVAEYNEKVTYGLSNNHRFLCISNLSAIEMNIPN